MTKHKNPRVGSTFESWLDEQGIREEVNTAAVKEMVVMPAAAKAKKKSLEEPLLHLCKKRF